MKCRFLHWIVGTVVQSFSMLFMSLLCSFLAMEPVAAQMDVTVSSYTIREGLSGNGITAIYQDSKGFIWIGTQDGLNMYDGYTFKVFRHNLQDAHSISGNHIQCINEDAQGNLWIGTIGNGLNKWDRATEEFTCFNSKSSSLLVLPEDNIYGLFFDQDSTLWAKTDNYLMNVRIDPLKLKIYNLYSNIFKYQDHLNVPVFRKSASLLWIGTKEGMAQFNTQDNLSERLVIDEVYGIYSNEIGAITGILPLAPKSYLLAGAQGVLQLKEQGNGTYTKREIDLGEGKADAVNAVVKLSNGAVFLGTKTGLKVAGFNEEEDLLAYSKDAYYNRVKSRITNEEVTCLYEDNSGLLWVGTRFGGLLKVDFKPKKFGNIKAGDDKYRSLNSFDVKSIYVDKGGLIWLGTAGKGLKILDSDNGDVYSYAVNRDLNKKEEDVVLSLCKDSKERVWIGTASGIYIFYLERGTISEFSYANSREVRSLLKQNRINTIEEDAAGNIWFGTQFGLYKYDGYSILNYFADKEEGICSDEINDLYLDSEGILWIGTSNGVNFIDTHTDARERIGHLRNFNDSVSVLSNNYILSIAEDKEDRLWFGTRSGVSFYSKKDDESGYYTHVSGLANDMIYGVLCDKNSGVWLSTNKGVSLIKNNKQVYNFDVSDGLPGYVFNVGAVAQSDSGMCYFGGVEGVAFIKPESIRYNLHKPDVVFTSIELFNRGKLLKRFKTDVSEIKLKYRKSSELKVKFAALEFSEPHKNKYQVYLEGFDDDWRPVSSENEVDISDLPSGDYTLHVKGANSDHVWSDKPISIKISLFPPIWMSNYAYAFYLIALVFLIQSIINYRIRHYKTAYKSLEEKAVDKKKIEAQRELLSKINQSLTDSIYYAKRIQESILPSEQKIKQVLPESFVYFRPKDLVSGDFYWVHEIGDKLFVAAVDCTGHGVPGAFMSIIAYDMLKGIINSDIEFCPAYILERLNKEVIATFKRNTDVGSNDTLGVNDGMDIALCMIDKKERKLSFAGAFNPLYLVRGNEIFVYKGDRFPIGYQGEKKLSFSKHDIALEDNDIFYIFSDGYADQFGGEDGKKFKYRRFRHLLLNIHKLPAEDQKAILHQKIEEWMGEHEQVDDMIVMGMRPLKG